MPSTHHEIDVQEPALQMLGELLYWLLGAMAGCVLGVAAGLLAARLMRRLHVHYGWATASVLLVLAARGALGAQATLGLLLASPCALARGRRWHREDLQAGEDLAEAAAGRLGPLGAMKTSASGCSRTRGLARGATCARGWSCWT